LTQANNIFALANAKKLQITPSLALAHVNASRVYLQRLTVKTVNLEITLQYQMVIDIIEMIHRTGYLASSRRKFGRIYQRFWFVRCCGSQRSQSEQVRPGHAMHASGSGFSAVEMKEHDA
jgi:hypothetical protein